MKFQLAVLSLVCAASSVTAFVPTPPGTAISRSVIGSSPSAQKSTAATAEAQSSTEETGDNNCTYQAAIDKAVATCEGALKDDHPELLSAAVHFCTEFITASQKSHEKYPIPETEALPSLERIMTGVKLASTYGLGENKFQFGPTHDAVRGNDAIAERIGTTFDFYEWGCDFFRYFCDTEDSIVLGRDNLQKAMEQAKNGENVILYGNHQSEADPQVMSILLETAGYSDMADKIIYVAGHKVTTDSLAIPFSMGRNLICIHSKKHIDADPDTKGDKTRDNMKAMSGMLTKLKAGGAIIWVAPSGGRDRRDVETGKTPIAPFDDKTIDMFRLMGKKSKVKTHYYPLSMVTYELCPPPDFVEAGTGEQRNFRFVPVGINLGPEQDAEQGEEFGKGVFEETKKGYREVRDRIFPGTAPED